MRRARAWLTEPVRVLAAMTRTLRGWVGAVCMSCLRMRVDLICHAEKSLSGVRVEYERQEACCQESSW